MLVEVRPLPLKKWHGKKGKEEFAQPKILEVLFDKETGNYATGLTEEEAEKYGKILGVDLSDKFTYAEPHPYWSTKPSWISLPNCTTIFNTENAADFVKVKNMKASKRVANSMKEWEEGKYPDATHVIYDEAEEIANKTTKIELKRKANQLEGKLSQEDKIAIVQILSDKKISVRGKSPNYIAVELDDIIENKTQEFIRTVELGREEVTIRGKVLEMVDKNILIKEGGSYYYMGELIGMDFMSTVEWFKDPQNSKMKVLILEQLEK